MKQLPPEDTLRDTEERFHTLADHIAQLAWMADPSGWIFWYNQRWLDYTGATLEQMQGWGWRQVHHPDHVERVVEKISRCFATGEIWEDTFPLRSAAGEYRWFLSRAVPIRDASGQVLRWFGTNTDITEQRRAEQALRESEERYRALTNAITSIVWRTSAEGLFVEPQDDWQAYTGQAWHAHRGAGWVDALHPDDRARVHADWKRALHAADTYQTEGRVWHAASQSYRYFEARGVPVRRADGTLREWVGTYVDVHDRKMSEAALRESDRRKSEFLALLGHELRNPLAAVVNGLQLLREDAPSAKAEQVRELVERQARHMTHLIDDLLDVTRISKGKISLRKEPLELGELARKAVADQRGGDGVPCRLEVAWPDAPLWIEGDPTRMTQVLGNLLHNACKFTPPDGQITLTATTDGAWAEIVIRDTGIGIDAELLDKLFVPFNQATTSLNQSGSGLGLGLALVRGVVELHGGAIAAHSDGLGHGSTFTLRLPLVEPVAPSAPVEAPAAPHEASGHRILLVEDSAPVAKIFALLLAQLGHEVQIAANANAALEVLPEFAPEVIFSDISMPGMSGYELAQHVRRQPAGDQVFLIAMTGYGQAEDRHQALRAGFDEYLVKPAEMEQVEAVLQCVRNRSRGNNKSQATCR